jgi:transposase
MPRCSKKKRANATKNEALCHSRKLLKYWKGQLAEFDGADLSNKGGLVRTSHENALVLCSIKMLLRLYLNLVEDKYATVESINWTMIEEAVSLALHVKEAHVKKVRVEFFDTGNIVGIEDEDADFDDETINTFECYEQSTKNKLSKIELQQMISEVDERHRAGRSVTNRIMRNFIKDKFNKSMGRSSVQRYFTILGLQWKPIKCKKRNVGAYRMDLLRDFLIKYNDYYTKFIEADDPEKDCDFIFVYTDETYINKGIGSSHSYFGANLNDEFNRSASKGERVVILHAITPFGPLCDRIDGIPIDDLKWKGDTPHPSKRTDGLLTCECIWKASSRAGDYHDNMDSDNFLKWVNGKLLPTFHKKYPGKKMVLICDNAAYHHKRKLGSFSSNTKQQLIDLAVKLEVKYIDLPFTKLRYNAVMNDDSINNVEPQECGNVCRVEFNADEMANMALSSTPFVPNIDELKLGLLLYIKKHHQDLLECEFEQVMKANGHVVLWTPPYSPDLQPIEMFWAQGKNFARESNSYGIKMKETIRNLRWGWYGNTHIIDDPNIDVDYSINRKEAANCYDLFRHSIDMANTKFLPICFGLSGEMGALVVVEEHERETNGIPIDFLMIDLIDDEEELSIHDELLTLSLSDDDESLSLSF